MSPEQEQFFQRQMKLSEIGKEGQKTLLQSSVLIVGLGGLGSPASLQLATSGVGRLGLVDYDIVEMSNLHRQTSFALSDIGRPKTEVTKEFLLARVPGIKVETFTTVFSKETSRDFLNSWDIVLDCTDSIPAKYAINDLCIESETPNIMASLYKTSAQFALFGGQGEPCYRCLYPNLEGDETRSCADVGVLSVMTALAGTYQAAMTVRYLLHPESVSYNTLHQMEWESNQIFETKIQADPKCIACGNSHQEKIRSGEKEEITPKEFHEMQSLFDVVLLDVREESEWSTSKIPDAIFFPLSKIQKGEKPKFPDHTMVVAICEVGIRSRRAIQYLKEEYAAVFSLAGGRKAYLPFLSMNSIELDV